MRKFQDTYETRKRLFISAFSICMTVPLKPKIVEKTDYAHIISAFSFHTQFKSNNTTF